MKLWAGKHIDDMPNGYTYIDNIQEAQSFIYKCERMRKAIGNDYNYLWSITEICVPIDEVEEYAKLFSHSSLEAPRFKEII